MKNNKLGKRTENEHVCDRGIWVRSAHRKGTSHEISGRRVFLMEGIGSAKALR